MCNIFKYLPYNYILFFLSYHLLSLKAFIGQAIPINTYKKQLS